MAVTERHINVAPEYVPGVYIGCSSLFLDLQRPTSRRSFDLSNCHSTLAFSTLWEHC